MILFVERRDSTAHGRRKIDVEREHCEDHTGTCERLAALENSAKTLVSYKWLVTTILSLGAVIVATALSLNSISVREREKIELKIEQKTDKNTVATLIFDIEAIKRSNNRMDKNLVLVMRALNIKPEKE